MLRAISIGLTLFALTLFSTLMAPAPADALPFPERPASDAARQPDRQPTRPELIVALHEEPPYVIRTEEGRWDGIAVDLWRKVAEELEVGYRFEPVTASGYIDAIATGAVDVGLNPPTEAGAAGRVRFTQPYHTSTLAVVSRREGTIWKTMKSIFTMRFAKVALTLAGVFLLVGILIWAFERRSNEDQFQRSPVAGIWSGMWWAGVTMTTIGYGDKAPKTVPGRILALLWMLVAMGVTASLTATIVSASSSSAADDGDPVEELREAKRVGVLTGEEGASVVEAGHASTVKYGGVKAALDALEAEEIDAFVADSAAVAYSRGDKQEVEIRTLHAPRINHSLAVADDTLLAGPLEHALLDVIDELAWHENLSRWLGGRQADD